MLWTADPTCLMMTSLTSSGGTRWTCPASGRAGGETLANQKLKIPVLLIIETAN